MCEDCRILQVQNSDGSVSISKKMYCTYSGGHRTRKHNCKGVHACLIPGGGDGRALGMYPGVAGAPPECIVCMPRLRQNKNTDSNTEVTHLQVCHEKTQ